MKKILLTCLLLTNTIIFSNENEAFEKSEFYTGGKSAVIMTHFGTTHSDTRANTIEKINAKAKKAFDGKADVFEAYTSRIVIKRVAKNENIEKLNPYEMLAYLKKKGYKNIIIQPTTILDGIEMKSILKDAQNYSKSFKNLRIGVPLLTTSKNYERTINAISNLVGPLREEQAIVMVGHGTYDSSTSAYAMFDYMAKDMNKSIYVGTIEGYPTFDAVVRQLKKDGKKEIILMPLMFVAGDHAKNDIAEDWKNSLEKEGFKVITKLIPLGEIPEIQKIYIENAKFLETHRQIDISKKKANYSKSKEI